MAVSLLPVSISRWCGVIGLMALGGCITFDKVKKLAPDGSGNTVQSCAPSGPEVCNGKDDDCNGQTDEGFEVGAPCDGDDLDACNEGVWVCDASGGRRCTDNTGNNIEVCNGVDDDCNGQTDEGFNLGAACIGDDGDLCQDGTLVCDAGGGVQCQDTSDKVENVCTADDENCDGVTGAVATGTIGQGLTGDRPQVVWNGAEFAVLWADKRNTPNPTPTYVDLYFARFNRFGTLIAGSEVQVTQNNIARTPAMAFSPELKRYGVVYQRSSTALTFVQLDLNGAVVANTSKDLSTTVSASITTSIAWNPQEQKFAIVWPDSLCGNGGPGITRICINTISPTAELGTGTWVTTNNCLSNSEDTSARPSLVYGGGFYGVLYHVSKTSPFTNGICFQALRSDTLAPSGSMLPVATNTNNFLYDGAIDWSGNDFGVIWKTQNTPTNSPEIKFDRVSTQSARVGSSTFITPDPVDTNIHENLSLVWMGQAFLAAWGERPNTSTAFTTTGSRIVPGMLNHTVSPVHFAISTQGTTALMNMVAMGNFVGMVSHDANSATTFTRFSCIPP